MAQTGKLKVGLMLPYSGTFTALGVAIENGFKLYVDEQGGKLGGREVEFFKVDDESDPAKATDNVNKLIKRDQVDVIVGTVHSGVALAMAARHRQALEAMPPGLSALPRTQTGFIPRGLVGLDALRALVQPDAPRHGADAAATSSAADDVALMANIPRGLRLLVDDIERAGHGLVMTMGKGGVGKTTVAAAVAVELAARQMAHPAFPPEAWARDQRRTEAPRLLERHHLAVRNKPAAGRKLGRRNAAGDKVLHHYRLNFLYLMRVGWSAEPPSSFFFHAS